MQIPLEKEIEIFKTIAIARSLTKDEIISLLQDVLFIFARTEMAYKDIIGKEMFFGMYQSSTEKNNE